MFYGLDIRILMAVTAVIISLTADKVADAQDVPRIKAATVTAVEKWQGGKKVGSFNYLGSRKWQERAINGAKRDFTETGRDEWSVYMVDQDAQIIIDLWTKKVFYRVGNEPERELYQVRNPTDHKPPAGQTGTIDDFRILTYNTYLIHMGGGAPERDLRADQISNSQFMRGFDVVILNEMFDDGPSDALLNGLKAEYPYQTPTVGEDNGPGWDHSTGDYLPGVTAVRGGVVVISKWPIEEKIQHIYNRTKGLTNLDAGASGWDWLSNKGFAYIRIAYGDTKVHVIATHTQSADDGSDAKDGFAESWAQRQEQFRQINNFIVRKQIPAHEMVVIGGDLNVPGDTAEYDEMLKTLNVNPPTGYQGHASTWDPATNALIDDKHDDDGKMLPGERLDYLLLSKNHLQPSEWYNEVPIYQQSDHYPVYAGSRPTLPSAEVGVVHGPVEGFVEFFCEAGYVARFVLQYEADGKTEKIEKRLSAGFDKNFIVPAAATSVSVKGYLVNPVGSDSLIFSETFSQPPMKRYKVYGTIFDPSWTEY